MPGNVFNPQILAVGAKPFVQPYVSPGAASDKITKPLM
jgi:hypothetical protein